MTTTETVPLKYGMRAHYITHAELARQRRAEARRNKSQPEADQLEFEEQPQ
jgi:hypothetical protein